MTDPHKSRDWKFMKGAARRAALKKYKEWCALQGIKPARTYHKHAHPWGGSRGELIRQKTAEGKALVAKVEAREPVVAANISPGLRLIMEVHGEIETR